jgi:excinuclease ABC subunit C
MDLHAKIRTLPTKPGVYAYKNAEGEVIYVGKAKNLRARVRTYFAEGAVENAKTGSLLREAADLEYIVVGNEREALALENNLIKQRKPRYNILLRDDKSYPYVKLTAERYPRVYVTRRLRKDGATYYGPYFPASLAYRIVDLIHRSFLIPSCKIDLTRDHPRPCLQYHIQRCLGPCVAGLTTPELYAAAVRDTRLLLEGKPTELSASLRQRMEAASAEMNFESAARYRDLIVTVEQLHERQRMDAAEGDDADILSYHYEDHRLAVNLFHVRGGKVLDRREFFWEELGEMESAEGFRVGDFFGSLLQQLYLDAPYVPRTICIPVDFEERTALEELLSERRGTRVHIELPQRGLKRSLIDLVGSNARQSYEQRFRVMKPRTAELKAALQDVFQLPELPSRIECFDISHLHGTETVASMVVWEEGRMKNSGYRKFLIRTVEGIDDFQSMREVVTRRYRRLRDEQRPMPSLVLVDGGLGQLHAAARALEELGLAAQPLAALAKREETLYLFGQEDEPIVLDRHSPVLLLMQQIRDEAHRFAITFQRKRRQMRDHDSVLRQVPGVGPAATRRLLEHFGSLQAVKAADQAALSAVVTAKQAAAICEFFTGEQANKSGSAPKEKSRE